ncbi:hypothetical protein Hamer_G023829 [Homarus americanus]|uniref:Uncharacterized protein n=1 Tax=Homarus americanus TaxID=6706 RepID=A0A8J5KEQ2_HOMAM|nr:hypothetical protein Hamer_G023829 [Homarus americanus]
MSRADGESVQGREGTAVQQETLRHSWSPSLKRRRCHLLPACKHMVRWHKYHRTKCTEVWQSTVQSNRKQYYHKTTENGNTDLLTTRFSLDSKNVTARINWK